MLINVITRELNFIQHHHQQFPRINVLFPFCLPDTSCVVYRERKHTTNQVYHVPLTERYVTVSPQVVVNCCCCCCSHINSHIIICSIPWSQDRLQSQLWNWGIPAGKKHKRTEGGTRMHHSRCHSCLREKHIKREIGGHPTLCQVHSSEWWITSHYSRLEKPTTYTRRLQSIPLAT